MRPIVVLRGGEREADVRALGAWRTIVAGEGEWPAEVLKLTNGCGVDQVIEVIGGANLQRAIGVLAPGGALSLIGQLDRGPMTLPFAPVLRNRLRIQGIAIGSRRGFERMVRAVDAKAIAPVIDSTFGFVDAPKAFARLYQRPFGKVVIRVV
jgi:NADPH:quinone reductase-like Zn-dependent oxidoreductase